MRIPRGHEAEVAKNLNNMIIANDYALDFGLLGSKSVLRMLSKYGYNDTVRLPDRTAEFRSGHHKFKISKISEATRLSGSLDFTFF